MRTILLAGAAALALSVAPAMAQSAGSHGFINKSANSADGSNAASTGGAINTGRIGSDNQKTTNVSANKSLSNVGNRTLTDSANTAQGNTGAASGLGNAASATDGGLAINAALGSYDVSNKSLSVENTHVTVTLASAANSGGVNGNHALTFAAAANAIGNGMNGQGILTAQMNTGANSFQQNSVALGSVVLGSSGSGGFVGSH